MTSHEWVRDAKIPSVNLGCPCWKCVRCGDLTWKVTSGDEAPPTDDEVLRSGGVLDCDEWLVRDVMGS